ncbi:TPA: hypothetical protein N0F65_009218 [Lagenidium giganteum]|uniref:Uncharacterized protein n=1 Tax=Lagenidium giganteum TaxID=4803 RepID=A0AAV2YRM2_9STRA|nr:TPA: hypothetical protein N0F65_009218 [Lagenidium giganteum]
MEITHFRFKYQPLQPLQRLILLCKTEYIHILISTAKFKPHSWLLELFTTPHKLTSQVPQPVFQADTLVHPLDCTLCRVRVFHQRR